MNNNFNNSTKIIWLLVTSFIVSLILALYLTTPKQSEFEILSTDFAASSTEQNTLDQSDAKENSLSTNSVASEPKRVIITSNQTRKSGTTPTSTSNSSSTNTTNTNNAEHQQYLKTTLKELQSPQQRNNQDEHLPSISGRVLDPQGKPLDQIKIIATLRDYNNEKDAIADKLNPLNTESNAEGFYAFRDLPDGIYLLSTNSNKRYLPKRIEVRTGVKFADIVLTEMGIIQLKGKITDEKTRQVLSDVEITPLISGTPATIKSDINGEFDFELSIGEQINFPLRLQKNDYRSLRFNVNISDTSSYQNLQISMQPSVDLGELSGRVMGDKNEILESQQVQLYSPSLKKNYSAKTNVAGEFSFENVEQADDYNLKIRPASKYKDYSINRFEIGTRPVRKEVQLESLDSGYEISGQVLDRENKPVANLMLSFRSANALHQSVRITTDSNGAYHAKDIPEGQITIKSNGSPHFTLTGLMLNGSNRSLHRDLVVDHGEQKIIGKVLDSNGDPISTPKIYLSSIQVINGLRSQSSRTTSSDDEGKFLFTDLGSRQYSLSVSASGYKSGRITLVMGTQSEYVIRLDKIP